MKKKNSNVKKKVHKSLLNKLNNRKINKIYTDFKNSLSKSYNGGGLAVALSGGPDSLALSYLAKCYSLENNIRIFFYIVDHKLRNNSSKEAKKVKSILAKFDLKCQILSWKGKKPKSNIQSLARDKRYFLLANQCYKNNVKNILFAHHIDDLYENFFIRLLRGSGLHGLLSFNNIKTSKDENINILRPLIKFNKKDLIYIAKKVFKFYIVDPSNNSDTFKRVRLRKLIQFLKKEGLDEKKFKLTLNNLTKSNLTINFYVEKNIISNSKQLKNKSTFILKKNFFLQPYEIVFRSLSQILKQIGKKYYYPRGKSVDYILTGLEDKKLKKMTLAGCVIEKINNSVIIYKEIGKKN